MVHHTDTAITGAIGFTAPLAAATISLDPALDLELRIVSMVIGIFVGLASFAKLVYDIWSDHKARNKK
jgi:hypothetical protein